MIKLLQRVVEINNTGVTGQSLPPQKDFEHARGPRNSANVVNLTYETPTYITRKMVPITGRARSFLLFRCFQKQYREEGETE